MIGVKDVTDFLGKYGVRGLLAGCFILLCIIAVPEIKGWFQEYRIQGREDGQLKEINCQTLLQDMREERNRFLEEATALRVEMAELSAEMRLERRADYDSKVSRWRLDADHRLTWFNPVFGRQALIAQGVNPYTSYGQTWHELLDKRVADKAATSDNVVKRTLEAVSYGDGFTIEARPDGEYKVFWQVIKEPLIDDDDIYRGVRGSAIPYKEEKIK